MQKMEAVMLLPQQPQLEASQPAQEKGHSNKLKYPISKLKKYEDEEELLEKEKLKSEKEVTTKKQTYIQ